MDLSGYTIKIQKDEEGDYMATCDEFPGLSVFAFTPEDAIKGAHEILPFFIEHSKVGL